MEENQNKLLTRKNIITILIIGIIILAIPVGVKLSQESQVFKSRAAADTITFSGTGVSTDKTTTTTPNVTVELKSPLGPPQVVK
jgi:predicted negative regulator of RcsB-dependent stress response